MIHAAQKWVTGHLSAKLNRPVFFRQSVHQKVAPFELYRRNLADIAVAPSWVVEQFDIVKHIGACLIASGIDLASDPFTLVWFSVQSGKEPLALT